MPGVEKLSVSLTAEMAALLEAVVMSGEYASHSEVIREALRDWQRQKSMRLQNAEELRLMAIAGIRSGAGLYGGVSGIKKEAHRRHAAKRKKP